MSSRDGSLVRVWTDIGARKPVPLLARIIEQNGVIFTIRYLSESDDKIWRYEEDTYEIDSDSIAEHLQTDHEEDLGFQTFEDGFVKVETDDDYVPSDEETEETEDEDEDEDEEDDLSETEDEFENEFEEDDDEDEEENIDEE